MSLTDLLDSEMAQSFEAQGIIESERFKRKIFVKSLYLALLPSCELYLLPRQPSNYPITASVHLVFLATATRFIILCREQKDQKTIFGEGNSMVKFQLIILSSYHEIH